MFYVVNWFVVLGLLALWSLTAWALHSMVAWAVAHAGAMLDGSVSPRGLQLPDGLAAWVPTNLAAAVDSLVSAVAPAIEAVLAGSPALAGAWTVAAWVVWAIGSALLVVLGFVLSGMIALLRRKSGASAS